MAIYHNGSRAEAIEGNQNLEINYSGTRIYRYYTPSGTSLWSGETVFDSSERLSNSKMNVSHDVIQLSASFSKLRGIKMFFGLALIQKMDSSGYSYFFRSGQGVIGSEGSDGTTVSYPSTITYTQSQLIGSNKLSLFNSWDVTSSLSFITGNLVLVDTNGSNKLRVSRNASLMGDFDSMMASGEPFVGDKYTCYPVLKRIEAI